MTAIQKTLAEHIKTYLSAGTYTASPVVFERAWYPLIVRESLGDDYKVIVVPEGLGEQKILTRGRVTLVEWVFGVYAATSAWLENIDKADSAGELFEQLLWRAIELTSIPEAQFVSAQLTGFDSNRLIEENLFPARIEVMYRSYQTSS